MLSPVISRKPGASGPARRRLLRVLYRLSERRVRRYGLAHGVFQRLLSGGVAALAPGEVREQPLLLLDPSELLVASGWHRIGSGLSDGVYRVVIVQRAGVRHERLTSRELAVAELMARGWRSQRAGVELGIAAPTVRGALDRCLFKLELVSPTQLPLLWHALRLPGRRLDAPNGAAYQLFQVCLGALFEPLTHAERSLVERSLEGHDYRGIAAHRGVAVRTVVNQMARLYRKVGASSRVELVTRLIERAQARADP